MPRPNVDALRTLSNELTIYMSSITDLTITDETQGKREKHDSPSSHTALVILDDYSIETLKGSLQALPLVHLERLQVNAKLPTNFGSLPMLGAIYIEAEVPEFLCALLSGVSKVEISKWANEHKEHAHESEDGQDERATKGEPVEIQSVQDDSTKGLKDSLLSVRKLEVADEEQEIPVVDETEGDPRESDEIKPEAEEVEKMQELPVLEGGVPERAEAESEEGAEEDGTEDDREEIEEEDEDYDEPDPSANEVLDDLDLPEIGEPLGFVALKTLAIDETHTRSI
ncbi:hypothetical protein DXG01_012214 [Tephrocybe rancida]|nr:hypothetical protein DXG01_012214 [Tephrocybe rancida]